MMVYAAQNDTCRFRYIELPARPFAHYFGDHSLNSDNRHISAFSHQRRKDHPILFSTKVTRHTFVYTHMHSCSAIQTHSGVL